MSAPALRDPRAAGRWILNAAAGLSLGFIVLPLVFVIWLAFFKNEIVSFPPEGYTFRWFRAIFDQGKFVDGFIVSTQIGIVATAIGIVLAVPAALAISRHRFPAREWANTLLLCRWSSPVSCSARRSMFSISRRRSRPSCPFSDR